MSKLSTLLFSIVGTLVCAGGVRAQVIYQLDNNSISTALNASDGTEPLDNWFGNVFSVAAGGTLINRVDYGLFTNAVGATAQVVLYRVTGAGGNPALGVTRVYTQSFTPLTGDGTNAFIQQIPLTTPQNFLVGDQLLVAIFQANVIAAPPNDKYPYLLDTSGSTAGSFWDRANPNTFNLDDLSAAKGLDQALSPGGFIPGADHMIIRAVGVPEPSSFALLGLAGAAALLRRKKPQKEK